MAPTSRKSPRKTSTSRNSTANIQPKKARAPARCRVCPGKPLKSTCPCVSKPRTRKSAPEVTIASEEVQTMPDTQAPMTTVTPPAIPDSAIDPILLRVRPPPRLDSEQSTPNDSESTPIPRRTSATQASFPSMIGSGPVSSPFANTGSASIGDLFSMPRSPSTTFSDPAPSPFPDTLSASDGDPLTMPSSPSPGIPSSLSSHMLSSEPLTPQRNKRRQEDFGLVEGCMQGTQPLKLRRSNPLPEPITTTGLSVQRFGRVVRELLIKAERIAHETDGWLVIAAQHPKANTSFIHYTSPRLRQDALEQSEDLVNMFDELVTDLRRSREQDAFAMSQAFRKEAKRRESEARAHAEQLNEKQAQIDYLLKLTSQYRPSQSRHSSESQQATGSGSASGA